MKHLTILMAVIVLSACSTTPHEFGHGDPVKAMSQTELAMISARNAALENRHADIRRGELSSAEKAYRTAPKNKEAALRYSKLLRKVNMLEEADLILNPFASSPKKSSHDIMLEYAKIQIEKGNFLTGQNLAEQAMLMSDTALSRLVLGVSLDAQGHHKAAENHFNIGLDNVGSNIDIKNNLLNNLALSLLSQNKKNDARKALESIELTSSYSQRDIVRQNRNLVDSL